MDDLPPPRAIQETPAGWYRDPRGPGYTWWNGQRWSDKTSPAPPFVGPQAERQRANMERARFVLEIFGIVGVIIALGFSARSVSASTAAVEASDRQLSEAQYESVYQHQLDLWRLAAENEELAPYIIGGKRPNDPVSVEDATQATQQAALANALDFYAYVFSQLAPRDAQGNLPSEVLSAGERPGYVDQRSWEAWVTWAATIVAGFKDSPGMCDLLNEKNVHDDYAYEIPFRTAVADAVPNCVE